MLNRLSALLKKNQVPKSVWRDPGQFLAFGCGSGASPIAPGTVGTLAAIPPYLLLAQFHLIAYSVIVLFVFVFGCWLCERVSQQLKVHDHAGIVIDEWVGLWITLATFPVSGGWLVLGFLVFRVFDILKPWPIAWVDRHVENGVGIMLDDVLAAVYANVVLQILRLIDMT